MSLVSLCNGINVHQMRHYIKISVESYIDKISKKYLVTWMDVSREPLTMSMVPTAVGCTRKFLSAVDDLDKSVWKQVAKQMGIGYRSLVCEIICALVMCRPEIANVTVHQARYNSWQDEIH